MEDYKKDAELLLLPHLEKWRQMVNQIQVDGDRVSRYVRLLIGNNSLVVAFDLWEQHIVLRTEARGRDEPEESWAVVPFKADREWNSILRFVGSLDLSDQERKRIRKRLARTFGMNWENVTAFFHDNEEIIDIFVSDWVRRGTEHQGLEN